MDPFPWLCALQVILIFLDIAQLLIGNAEDSSPLHVPQWPHHDLRKFSHVMAGVLSFDNDFYYIGVSRYFHPVKDLFIMLCDQAKTYLEFLRDIRVKNTFKCREILKFSIRGTIHKFFDLCEGQIQIGLRLWLNWLEVGRFYRLGIACYYRCFFFYYIKGLRGEVSLFMFFCK